jgi:hypothetical protein
MCKPHKRRELLSGDPNAIALRRYDLKHARAEVKQFLKVHREHPAVQSALKWLRETVEYYAVRGTPYALKERRAITYAQRLAAECYRLHKFGCTAEEILEEVATVFSFTRLDPRRLPAYTASHDMQLARLVLNLRPRFSIRKTTRNGKVSVSTPRPSAVLLREFGNLLNRTLVSFNIAASDAITRHIQKEQRFKAEIAKSIEVSPFGACNPAEVVA